MWKLIKAIWRDPVWSKLIATALGGLITYPFWPRIGLAFKLTFHAATTLVAGAEQWATATIQVPRWILIAALIVLVAFGAALVMMLVRWLTKRAATVRGDFRPTHEQLVLLACAYHEYPGVIDLDDARSALREAETSQARRARAESVLEGLVREQVIKRDGETWYSLIRAGRDYILKHASGPKEPG